MRYAKHLIGLACFLVFHLAAQQDNFSSGLPHHHDIVAQDSLINSIIVNVSDTSIAGNIRGLEAFGTRHMSQPNRFAVANWIKDRFIAAGVTDVVLDSFQYGDLWQANVVATIPGIANPEREIIVGGHYDSQSYNVLLAPGADDNASGTAAIIEMARVLKMTGYVPNVTLRFIAFAAEEVGLAGSDHYAALARAAGRKIVLMQNYDMIGHRLTTQQDRDVYVIWYPGAEAMASLDSAMKRNYTTLTPVMSSAYRDQSDSWPFHVRGYKSVFTIEHDFSPVYHSPGDYSTLLDFHYAAEIVQSGLALLVTVDDRELLAYRSIADIPDTLNFGPINIGFPDTLTIAIKNTETEDSLIISSISIDHPVFSVSPSALTIPKNYVKEFHVVCSPADTGLLIASLSITGGPKMEVRNIVVTATGQHGAVIAVNTDSVGTSLYSGRTEMKTIVIRNDGGSDLKYSITINTNETPSNTMAVRRQSDGYSLPMSVRARGNSLGQVQSAETAGGIIRENINFPAPISVAEGTDASAVHGKFVPSGYFYDSFESGSFDQWSIGSASALREITAKTAARGIRSFHYKYSGWQDHFNGIYRTFAPDTRPSEISFYVRSGSTSRADAYFVITDDQYYECIWFYARDNGRFYVNDESTGDNTYAYNAMTWYKVEFKNIDWNASTFDYYVNGEPVKMDIPMRNQRAGASMGELHLYNFDPSEAWYDGIDIGGIGDWLSCLPDSGTIPAGGERAIDILFKTNDLAGGVYRGELTIASNDPVHPFHTVPAQLTVISAPALTVDTTVISFGKTLLNDIDTVLVTVKNTGNQDLLIFSAAVQPAEFSIAPTFAGIDPGDEEIFTVLFRPSAVGRLSGTLTMTSNDPVNGTSMLSLQGTGSKIHLVEPTGGERYFINYSRTIRWNSVATPVVNIEYSTDSGVSWILVADHVDANVREWEWIVPNTPSEFCKIRIASADDSTTYAESDSVFTISEMVITDGLVAYYPFDGNLNDESGNGHPAKNIGAVLTKDRFGISSSAYYFDGNSTLYVDHDSVFSFTDEYTFTYWVRLKYPDRNQKIIAKSKATNNGFPGYILGVTDGHMYPETYDITGINNAFVADSSFPADTWTHMAVSYKVGGHLKAFQNGTLIHSILVSNYPIGTNDLPLYIGSWNMSDGASIGGFTVDGDIDDIRVYNRELHNEEIKAIFATEQSVTSVDKNIKNVPTALSLEQNFPNPFNPITTIRYALPHSARVNLAVYDLLGRKIETLVDEVQTAGWKEVTWSGATVSSGLYFYRITVIGSATPNQRFTQLKKMVLVK
jgi:hypothetical protein